MGRICATNIAIIYSYVFNNMPMEWVFHGFSVLSMLRCSNVTVFIYCAKGEGIFFDVRNCLDKGTRIKDKGLQWVRCANGKTNLIIYYAPVTRCARALHAHERLRGCTPEIYYAPLCALKGSGLCYGK